MEIITKISNNYGCILMVLLVSIIVINVEIEFGNAEQVRPVSLRCGDPASRCYNQLIRCPYECPLAWTWYPETVKVCYLDCYSPIGCHTSCKYWNPDCETYGAACYDPRFIGGDGIVFYFHGKSNEAFSLVSNAKLQINGRFIGHRPAGRTRDFTWIQSLGILFGAEKFTVRAAKTPTWSNDTDHLRFTYNGEDLIIPEGTLPSVWSNSPENEIEVQRISRRNSIALKLKGSAEILVKVVPVTKEDDRIHGYRVPADDCFAHLEVQFRFFGLSPEVEGVLGRTYQPDFVNPAKPGVAMPVVGGEDEYRVSSLLSADCKTCRFNGSTAAIFSVTKQNTSDLDCTNIGASTGDGIVCRK